MAGNTPSSLNAVLAKLSRSLCLPMFSVAGKEGFRGDLATDFHIF